MIMNETVKPPRGTAKFLVRLHCYLLAFFAFGVFSVQSVRGQDNKTVPLDILNQPRDHRSAHAHNADMSCCKPCVPTAADRDPDVVKRPCFVRALNKARVNYGIFRRVDPDLPGDRIPEDEQAQFKRFLEQVFTDECLPKSWTAAQRSAFSTASAPDEAWIEVASWKAPIGEVRASRVRKTDAIKLRLKVAPDHRLAVHVRPAPGPDFDPDVRVQDEKQVFFETKELHDVLAGLFREPFDKPDDYVVHGGTRDFEGVLVFVGNVFSTHRSPTDPHWYDTLRLLVTDSDPQYVGVVIDLRAEAKKERTK